MDKIDKIRDERKLYTKKKIEESLKIGYKDLLQEWDGGVGSRDYDMMDALIEYVADNYGCEYIGYLLVNITHKMAESSLSCSAKLLRAVEKVQDILYEE